MMRVLLCLSLLAACDADMPSRRMQAATTSPPATTTPGTTVTTTPGASFQSTTTIGGSRRLREGSADGRRLLPAVSSDFMQKAYCASLTSAQGYCSAVATEAADVWTIIATITTTAAGAATTQAALNALTIASVQTAVQSYLVAQNVLTQADANQFVVKSQTNKPIAAQPFVPPPASPVFEKPPFKFTFMFQNTGGAAFPNLTAAQESAIAVSTVDMLATVGLPKQYVGVDVDSNMGTFSQWGVSSSVIVPNASVNDVAATLVEVQQPQNLAICGQIITKELAKILAGFNNSVTIETFTLLSSPTGADAALGKSLVNFSTINVASLRLYEKHEEGTWFDADDNEDGTEDEKPVGALASWTMPILGAATLIVAVMMIGINMRRASLKKSTRALSALHQVQRSTSSIEAESLIENGAESALE